MITYRLQRNLESNKGRITNLVTTRSVFFPSAKKYNNSINIAVATRWQHIQFISYFALCKIESDILRLYLEINTLNIFLKFQ